MNVVGIIAEYNPFHNGHYYHLNIAKETCQADYAIVVMSGNFVQRGEPAIFNKWLRAQMGILCGVDLVIELPFVYSLRSAQFFAAGAARLLDKLGIVTHLAFGAEEDDLTLLNQYANAFFTDTTRKAFYEGLDAGLNYAKALGQAVQNSVSNTSLNFSPNNILAIEYLRAIKKYNLSLQPVAIKRKGSCYHQHIIDGNIASATAIRQELITNGLSRQTLNAVPLLLHDLYQSAIAQGTGPVELESLAKIILYTLRLQPSYQLEEICDISEGLEHVLKRAALHTSTIADLVAETKSKRYTYTRLQRILMHIIMGTPKSLVAQFDQSGPLYARVLAFNDKGRMLLKQISKSSTLPIITKISKFLNTKQRERPQTLLQQMLVYDTMSTDIYNICIPNPLLSLGAQDFVVSPLYLSHKN